MATVKISQLPALTGANTAATDVIPIVDVSGNITNKITREEFFKNIQSDVEIADKIVHSGDTNTSIRFPAADTVTVETSGAERLRVDSSGNVGIGNTAPSAKLMSQVNTFTDADKVAFKAYNAQGVGAYASFQNSATGTAFTDGFRIGIDDSENAVLQNLEATNMLFATSATERMRIDSSGNVGIGTSSPGAKLHVESAGGSGGRVLFGGSTTSGYATNINVTDTGMEFWAQSNSRGLTFSTGATQTERMRITSAGNVGIGTNSPVVALDVNGDVELSGVVYKNQPAQTSKAAAATLTIAELLTGIIQYTGGAATLTLPTGTLIEGGTPASFPTNMSFDFSVINTGSGTATLGTATGLTLVGAMTVTAGASGMFRVRKTATNTYTVYRIA